MRARDRVQRHAERAGGNSPAHTRAPWQGSQELSARAARAAASGAAQATGDARAFSARRRSSLEHIIQNVSNQGGVEGGTSDSLVCNGVHENVCPHNTFCTMRTREGRRRAARAAAHHLPPRRRQPGSSRWARHGTPARPARTRTGPGSRTAIAVTHRDVAATTIARPRWSRGRHPPPSGTRMLRGADRPGTWPKTLFAGKSEGDVY